MPPGTRRRLDFNNIVVTPAQVRRIEVNNRLLVAANRLQHMNETRMSDRNYSLATAFLNAVIRAQNGNATARNAALLNLNRVRRIPGFNNNRPVNRAPARQRAATTIQRIWRGGRARNRVSNIRRYHRARTVVGPGGNIMIAIPTRN